MPRRLRKLFTKTVYIPVVQGYSQSYNERWQDFDYLDGVSALQVNRAFNSEVMQGLSALRDAADLAKTPDELKGCNAGIIILKKILTAPARAADTRKQLQELSNND